MHSWLDKHHVTFGYVGYGIAGVELLVMLMLLMLCSSTENEQNYTSVKSRWPFNLSIIPFNHVYTLNITNCNDEFQNELNTT